MCSLTNEFTIDNKSENNLRYSKVFLHHYYLLWIFSSFSAALVLTTYHLKPMLTAACTNLFKSIEMTPMIKSFRQICMYLHNFISFSFFFFNFQIHSTTGKNYLQQNSISTSTQWSCKHDHFLFSLVIAQKIEHTYKIAPN